MPTNKTTPVSRRTVLGAAGTTAGSLAVPGILTDVGKAEPGEFCDFVWPMRGKIIYPSESLDGVNIMNETGTPISAPRAGEVTYVARVPSAPDGPGRSYQIDISHGNGYTTSYSTHATTVAVSEGDHVERGQLIGVVGSVGYEVPFLHFSIQRQGDNLSVPGTKGQRVYAGDVIQKDYPGIECPNGGPGEDTGPGPIFFRLKEEKLALATRIETISRGSIQEKKQVQTVIGNLETAVTDGTISSRKARNSIQRLKLGEQVTERTIVGAGPATGSGPNTDIASPTAKAVFDTVTSMTLALIPFDKLIRKIPFGDKIMDTVQQQVQKGVKRLITGVAGGNNLDGFVNNTTDNIATDTYNGIKKGSLRTASGVRDKLVQDLSGPKAQLVSNFLNSIENGKTARSPYTTELNEALDDLNRVADPTTGSTFGGSIDGATQAASQGIGAANGIIKETMEEFETYENLTNILGNEYLNAVISIVTAAGFFSAILSILGQIADTVVSLGTAILNLLKAGAGWVSLTDLRDNHAQTLDAIAAGGN
jgi:hypothetical protein